MAPFLNDQFPNLQGSTQMTDDFDLYDYLGKSWAIIFMHPGDFTPVCTTELGEAAILEFEFKNRGVKIVGFSCSPKEQHDDWIRDIRHVAGKRPDFPIFSDPTRQHARALGVLDKTNVTASDGLPLTVRAVYILDPNKTIRLMTAYPASTGRNMDEILRSLDSLLLADKYKVATPCNWKPGDDVIVDYSLTDAMADLTFGKQQYRVMNLPSERDLEKKNEKELEKHYLRYIRDPSVVVCSQEDHKSDVCYY